ncbi:hypothetical protein [Nonomuraea sp. NPDC050310]|uniref:hypothetical protein n=1 Tax=Nonomuraea sp. NPDC050310 TaxID=3154935 RepID=UPI0033EACF27
MKVGEARAVAARWVADHRADGWVGAYVSGSAAWLPETAELPPASDVDVIVVVDGERPKLGKFRYDGVLLDVSFAPMASAEAVLGSPALAPALSRGVLLADSGGRLGRVQAEVAARFGAPEWVLARCAAMEDRIAGPAGEAGVAGPAGERRRVAVARPDEGVPPAERVLAWAFPVSLPTLVVLTAARANPTVRKRYVASREVLLAHGQGAFHEEVLGWLGCAGLDAARVGEHLDRLASVYDRVPYDVAKPYGSDLTPEARPVSIDGTRELIEQGLHREAVWWILVTLARCVTFDPHGTEALRDLLGDLGVAAPEAMRDRAAEVAGALPRLRQVRDAVLATPPRR